MGGSQRWTGCYGCTCNLGIHCLALSCNDDLGNPKRLSRIAAFAHSELGRSTITAATRTMKQDSGQHCGLSKLPADLLPLILDSFQCVSGVPYWPAVTV